MAILDYQGCKIYNCTFTRIFVKEKFHNYAFISDSYHILEKTNLFFYDLYMYTGIG